MDIMCKTLDLRSKVNGTIKVSDGNDVMGKKNKDFNSLEEVVAGKASKGKVGIHGNGEGKIVGRGLAKAGAIEFNENPHDLHTLQNKLIRHLVSKEGKEQFKEAAVAAVIAA